MNDQLGANNFLSLYSDLGVVVGPNGVPLHERCIHCQECWTGAKHRFPSGPDSHISYPWIGPEYLRSRLLVLGINMNSHGGLNAINKLVLSAQGQILNGKKKLFPDKKTGYRGGIMHHRVGCYSAIYLQSKGIIQSEATKGMPTKKCISESFNYISFTNQIKCSPDDEKRKKPSKQRSKPTQEMWINCNKYILKKELSILLPKCVFIIGNSDNSEYFKNQILDSGYKHTQRSGAVTYQKGSIDNRDIDIFVFPHPASKGGNKLTIGDDLRRLVS